MVATITDASITGVKRSNQFRVDQAVHLLRFARAINIKPGYVLLADRLPNQVYVFSARLTHLEAAQFNRQRNADIRRLRIRVIGRGYFR